MNKVLIKKIFAAIMAAAVMASFTAVSVYADPDMIIGEEEDVEYSDEEIIVEDENEDAEEENPEEDAEEENPVEEETEDTEEENPEETPDSDEPTDDDLLTTLPEPTYTPSGDLTMYASTTINVRQGPSTDYDKLGVLYAGDKVTVVGYNGEWMAFTYSGTTGFVLGSLLSETPPATETTTTTQSVQTAPPEEEPEQTETEAPVETDVVIESEAPEASESEKEEETTTTKPVEDKPEEDNDEDEETGAAPVEDNKDGSGLQGILIAALCALGTFILVGVLPVVIHRIHHKKLYQY